VPRYRDKAEKFAAEMPSTTQRVERAKKLKSC